MQTLGLSPKVLLPVVAQLVIGVVLLAFGNDVEGRTLLLAAAGTFGVGYQAAPGIIDLNIGAPSDALLGDDIASKLEE